MPIFILSSLLALLYNIATCISMFAIICAISWVHIGGISLFQIQSIDLPSIQQQLLLQAQNHHYLSYISSMFCTKHMNKYVCITVLFDMMLLEQMLPELFAEFCKGFLMIRKLPTGSHLQLLASVMRETMDQLTVQKSIKLWIGGCWPDIGQSRSSLNLKIL